MSTLFSVSIALLAGLLMTRVLKPLKMPDVTAYLLAGVLVGPFSLGLLGVEGLGFTSLDSVASLSLISEVALGFIAFSIGNEFRLSDLKHIGRQAVVIGIVQALLATLFVDLALLTLHLLFPALITPAQAITLVVGTIDLISILVNPFVAIVVSLLLGAATGWPLTKPETLFHSNTNRLNMTIAFVFLTASLAMAEFRVGPIHVGFSPLLVCMMLCAVFCNLYPLSHDRMEKTDCWTSSLFALFFVISGAELVLSVFTSLAIIGIGVVYILFRSAGKILGSFVSTVWTRCPKAVCRYLGITLLPQAGVALGMCLTARQAGCAG